MLAYPHQWRREAYLITTYVVKSHSADQLPYGSLPGKDTISKSMHKALQYAAEIRTAFDQEDANLNADEIRNRAEWARKMSSQIRKHGTARAKNVPEVNGEVLQPPDEKFLHDTMAIPDLAAVEASLNRSRLLLPYGSDVAAMALDASNSIQASNSLEKMLAHQLAAAHNVAMEQLGRVSHAYDGAVEAKRINAAAKCMALFQQGLLTLRKLRHNGQQRIMVQYVNVSDGGQAVIGSVENTRERV